jgi:hypothetical protein
MVLWWVVVVLCLSYVADVHPSCPVCAAQYKLAVGGKVASEVLQDLGPLALVDVADPEVHCPLLSLLPHSRMHSASLSFLRPSR